MLAEEGLANVPVPLTTVHFPVPIVGVLAESVVEVVVMFCVVPALEAVGGASIVTAIAALGLSQPDELV